MGSVLIIGAGPAGLTAGMLLAKAGVDVLIVDKDPSEPPETAAEAWSDWSRHGVAQFRLAHTLLPGGGESLRNHLPDVHASMTRFGAHAFNTLSAMPPTIADRSPRPGDDRFSSLAARRPIYELAFAQAADTQANLEIRRGTAVTRLVSGPEVLRGAPHVVGVELDDGSIEMADLVIDAAGRRSPLPALLEDLGARRPHEEAEDSRFVYYTRFYRKKEDVGFPERYGISLLPVGSISLLTLAGDNDTWSTTLFATTADKSMRAARDPEVFERVVRSIDGMGSWVDGEAITDIAVMAGISDRERTMVVDGRPVATGIVPIADAWACTNPSLGRGISMALMHATTTYQSLIETLDRPAELVEAWHTITRDGVQRFHESTRREDRARNREMDAIRSGSHEPTGRSSAIVGARSREASALFAAMMTDPDVYRAVLEVGACISTLDDVTSRPEVREKAAQAQGVELELATARFPTRQQLEQLLS
jgi:2-polyprenyl-6-methoxyphenol hydroxylase-like FAD-dependent oxidoreductase